MSNIDLDTMERYAIYGALIAQAERNRLNARNRTHAGPEQAHIRKVLRNNAAYYEQLAGRIYTDGH